MNIDIKEWWYIDINNNLVDYVFRGLNVEELMKLNWFSGFVFFWEKEILFSEEEIFII